MQGFSEALLSPNRDGAQNYLLPIRRSNFEPGFLTQESELLKRGSSILDQSRKCTLQSILALIAEPEMLTKRYIPHTIPVARCVFRCEVAKLIPVLTAMELSVAGCKVSEGVEWRVVCVALHGLDKNRGQQSPFINGDNHRDLDQLTCRSVSKQCSI